MKIMSAPSAKRVKLDVNSDKPNRELADMLKELADYEKNVNRQVYKSNAYRKAMQTLLDHPTKITSGKEAKKLAHIGERIAKKIDEYIQGGMIKKLEKVRQNDDANAIKELTRVTGIGPAAAQNFVQEGIRSIEDLKTKISKLNHHQKIGLKYLDDFEKRIPRDEMTKMEELIIREIKNIDKKFDITICGSYRRGAASSGDIDILITHPSYTSEDKSDEKSTKKTKINNHNLLKPIVDQLENIKFVTDTISLGNTKFMGVCKLDDAITYRRIDIMLTPKDQYYLSVLYFTGSDIFNKNMRKIAIEKGFKLNEYSIRKLDSYGHPGEPLKVTCEKDVFDYIGMEYKKPDERNAT